MVLPAARAHSDLSVPGRQGAEYGSCRHERTRVVTRAINTREASERKRASLTDREKQALCLEREGLGEA